jgi:hypothetical protein
VAASVRSNLTRSMVTAHTIPISAMQNNATAKFTGENLVR